MNDKPIKKRRWLRNLIIFLICAIGIFVWTQMSSWPFSMVYRMSSRVVTISNSNSLRKHAPDGINSTRDIRYDVNDNDAYLDIYYSAEHDDNTATIVWVHGGGWIEGNKNDIEPWASILAGRGFDVAVINYSLAPESRYPLPVIQVNRALEYLDANNETLDINTDRLFLGGSSAGSHIIAQVALLTVSSNYSSALSIEPTIRPNQIKGLLLYCGPYDLDLVNPTGNSVRSWLVRNLLWVYTDDRNFYDSEYIGYMSIPQNLTADFPPSFITAGNVDPLAPHSESLARALNENNVPVDTLFYPSDHTPALNHEYQFNLDIQDGQTALDRMISFVKRYNAN